LESEQHEPIGYKDISVLMLLDLNPDITREMRLCVGGYMTPTRT